MLKKFIYTAALGLICSASLKAQDTRATFLQAYEAYEGGDYSGSLAKITAVEQQLGKTNSKIQSLKTLVYNDKGDVNRALLELELYFRTSPDKTSSEYESMLTLYKELREGSKARFDNAREELEQQKQQELRDAEKTISAEKDQYYYKVAREAGTIEAYELFLQKNSTDSLKLIVEKLLAEERQTRTYETLVSEGMALMTEQAPLKAAEKFKAARELKSSAWLDAQVREALEYSADIAWQEGNAALLEGRWITAVNNFKQVVSVRNTAEAKNKLQEAQDEAAYAWAARGGKPEAYKSYLQTYPQGLQRKAAEGFLLRHYMEAASRSFAAHQSADVKAYLNEVRALQSAGYWNFFKEDYYKLMLQEAEYLSSGSKKERIQNILPAIAYYEELNQSAGGKYKSKLKSLNWKNKEWNRSGVGYFGYRSDATFNEVGFDIGFDKNRGIGMNVSIRMSPQALATDDFKRTDLDYVKGMLNLNFTKKIVYPLWIYAGAGYANFQNVEESASDPTRGYLGDISVDTFNIETGVSLHLKPVYLAVGSSFPYLNAKQNAQLGFSKTPSYLNVAIGIGW